MIVTSDTTPLISLMKAGLLDLLETYFGEVQIPMAVFKELTSNTKFAEEAEKIKGCKFIKVTIIDDFRFRDIEAFYMKQGRNILKVSCPVSLLGLSKTEKPADIWRYKQKMRISTMK